jgi:hypothetical protein
MRIQGSPYNRRSVAGTVGIVVVVGIVIVGRVVIVSIVVIAGIVVANSSFQESAPLVDTQKQNGVDERFETGYGHLQLVLVVVRCCCEGRLSLCLV